MDKSLNLKHMEKMKAYYERKKNAFRLFGKYYENLWD